MPQFSRGNTLLSSLLQRGVIYSREAQASSSLLILHFVENYRLERNRDISQGAGLANAESRERSTTRGGAHQT